MTSTDIDGIDLENINIEAIWIELFINNSSSLLISVVYLPPDSSKHLSKSFEQNFNDVLMTTAIKEETIILGDMNFDFLKTLNHKSIKDIIKRFCFTQILKLITLFPRLRALRL